MEILTKKYKEVSHIPIEEIKKMQHKYAKDILQPFDQEGRVNPEYVQHYGAKNLRLSDDDIRYLEKKGGRELLEKVKNDKTTTIK